MKLIEKTKDNEYFDKTNLVSIIEKKKTKDNKYFDKINTSKHFPSSVRE
jgi:hypothetical protein